MANGGVRGLIVKSLIILPLLLCLLTCTASNRESGFVYYRITSDPASLDPALVVDVNAGTIAAKLYNGLVRLGEGLSIIPDLAESWQVSQDGLVYTFKLRRGVTFSTSKREVKAGDFKYSFQRVLDPSTKSPNVWIFERVMGSAEFARGAAKDVKGIRVIDDYTLEIRLLRPFGPFLGLLTMPAAYVVPMEDVLLSGPDFSSKPVGTGPYVLGKWAHNGYIKLTPRKDYFGEAPKVNGIVYRVIPEDLTAVADFEIGNIDVLGIPNSEYKRYTTSPKWRGLITSIDGLNTYYLGLNCSRPPFNDPKIRAALSHAIDRQRILKTLYEGRGRLASGPVPDAMRAWPLQVPYDYDPENAAMMLKGIAPERLKADFYISADPQTVDTAEVIQSYLKSAGFDVRIRQLEWSAFKAAINKGEADMFWLSWWADYPDAENFLFPLFHSSNHGPSGNRARYANAEVDSLIDAGRETLNPVLRKSMYEKAERIIVEEAPWVFFWHRTDFTVRQPWVGSMRMHPIYSMDKGLDISL